MLLSLVAASLLLAGTTSAESGASGNVKISIELRCSSTPERCEAALAALTGQRPSAETVSRALVPGGVMLDAGPQCRTDAAMRVCEGV